MIKKLAEIANTLDDAGQPELAEELDVLINKIVQAAKKKKKPLPSEFILPADHPKVRDEKDHFPLTTIFQARNALARVNQFEETPIWFKGTLKELVSIVVKAVGKKYPSIEISDAAKKPGKG